MEAIELARTYKGRVEELAWDPVAMALPQCVEAGSSSGALGSVWRPGLAAVRWGWLDPTAMVSPELRLYLGAGRNHLHIPTGR